MARRLLAIVVAVTAAALLLATSGSPRSTREGGTFRVAALIARVDTIDPALVNHPAEFQLLDPACSGLVAFPDKPLPAGYRLTPELAEAAPVVSRDGRTYTFTVRKDARFSTGAQVTARAFVHALERILTPAMQSEAPELFENVLGARKMLAGKATTLAGAVARGRTLTLRLREREPRLLEFLTSLCAVPPNLPADPEGAKAPLPSAAPYFVSEYVPGERLVLSRNRFYRGPRPRHVDRFVADLAVDGGSLVDLVANGTFDAAVPNSGTAGRVQELAQRYGVNKSQFFVVPGNARRSSSSTEAVRSFATTSSSGRRSISRSTGRRSCARLGRGARRRPTSTCYPASPGTATSASTRSRDRTFGPRGALPRTTSEAARPSSTRWTTISTWPQPRSSSGT
jgi:ABC-type oligopeptide transport system substrate-binding subunit